MQKQKNTTKHPGKLKSSALAKAPMSKAAKGKKWSVGASWDGFGVKAGLAIDSRNVHNPNKTAVNSGPVFNHSEVVATLRSPAALTSSITVAHLFQPGMETQFPWLHTQAGGYQQYRVHSAKYRYEPFVSVFANTGVQGRVSMYFDYITTDPIDDNIDDMLNKAPSINQQAAQSMSLSLNPKFMVNNTRRTKYVRLDDESVTTNYDNYDAGRLIIGLDEFTAVAEFGKIWVDYCVEFVIPSSQKVPNTIGSSVLVDAFLLDHTSGPAIATTVWTPLDLGWSKLPDNAGNVVWDPTAGHFVLEKGNYIVNYKFIVNYSSLNNIYTLATRYNIGGSPGPDITVWGCAAPNGIYAQTAGSNDVLGTTGGPGAIIIPEVLVGFTAWPGASYFVEISFVSTQ